MNKHNRTISELRACALEREPSVKFFQFSENNSGGSWWLSVADYRALVQTGHWGIERNELDDMLDDGDAEATLRHSLIGAFDTFEQARASFESVTGADYYAEGCACCGRPFGMYETHLESELLLADSLTLALTTSDEGN